MRYLTLDELCIKESSNIAQKDLEQNNGQYPIYGASGFLKRVDFYHQDKTYIAIVKDGAGIGRTMLLPAKSSVIGTLQYIKLKTQDVVIDYLYYAIVHMNLSKYYSGATIPHIYYKDYKKEIVKIPNLETQCNIVRRFRRIDKLKEYYIQKIELLDKLVKSRFIELFGDPLKNEMSWPTMKMSKVAPAVSYAGDIEAEDGKFWLLNLDMVESNTGRILDKVMVSADDIGPSTVKFSPDNVLYSKLRPYLNKVAVPDEYGYVTTEMIPLLPLKQHLNTTFFSSLLRGDGFLQYIKTQVSGTKMPRVQMTTFWNFEVILPPLEKQERFSAFVHQSDKSKLAVQKSLEELEILKKSLMQQYFG